MCMMYVLVYDVQYLATLPCWTAVAGNRIESLLGCQPQGGEDTGIGPGRAKRWRKDEHGDAHALQPPG